MKPQPENDPEAGREKNEERTKTISQNLLLVAMAGAVSGCTLIDGTPTSMVGDEWPTQQMRKNEEIATKQQAEDYREWLRSDAEQRRAEMGWPRRHY